MKTYIIGHMGPDTDSVVSSLAFAFLCQHVPSYKHLANPTPAITGFLNPESSYLLNKFNTPTPKLLNASAIKDGDNVILVDHNEESQRLTNLNPDQITSIVDHHKVNLNLNQPIFLTFKPWGSTCTIIGHLLINTHKTNPDKNLASLMLGAILSDTVGFKSSTCTTADKEIGQKLAEIAKISDIDSFTLEIFKAKSDVSKLTVEQIIKNDYKVFDFNKKTFINQIETVEQASILGKKLDLLKALENVKKQQSVELVFCAITDIFKVNTKLLCLGDEEAKVAESAFGGRVGEHIIDIGPKLSRKKDIAPPIEKSLS